MSRIRNESSILPSGREATGLSVSGTSQRYSGGGGGENGSMAAVAQLFQRITQEIEENQPKNCIHFIVDFLCKHYPEHLHGFASIWQMDPDLERERHEVVNFFKAHKISTAVAAHFTNAGYDTLDTLTTLSPDSLVDIEAFNNVKWLPGHKVRLQQIFAEISARVRAYRQQYGNPTAPRRGVQSLAGAPTYDMSSYTPAMAAIPTTAALPAAAAQPTAMYMPPQVAAAPAMVNPGIAANGVLAVPGAMPLGVQGQATPFRFAVN